MNELQERKDVGLSSHILFSFQGLRFFLQNVINHTARIVASLRWLVPCRILTYNNVITERLLTLL